jgi:hypothetical protein
VVRLPELGLAVIGLALAGWAGLRGCHFISSEFR